VTRDGREALSLTRKVDIDFVICDWELPYITGIEMLKIMKGEPDNFLIPFMMLTSSHFDERYLYALEEGADACLPVPFTENIIINMIETILDRKAHPPPHQFRIDEMMKMNLQEDHDRVISMGYEFLTSNNDIRAALLTGDSLYKKRKLKEAEQILEKATQYAKNSKVYDLLGKINMDKKDDIRSMGYFRKAQEINPLNTDRQLYIARSCLKRGEKKAASRILQKLIHEKPSYMTIINIGKMYLEYGYVKEAAKYLETLDPIMETAELFYMFTIRLWQIGKRNTCIRLLIKYMKKLPQCHFFSFHLGVIFMRKKQYKQAEILIQNSLEINPTYEPARKCLKMMRTHKYI
jgi:two-component system chemotaxis response regulator CheY